MLGGKSALFTCMTWPLRPHHQVGCRRSFGSNKVNSILHSCLRFQINLPYELTTQAIHFRELFIHLRCNVLILPDELSLSSLRINDVDT